MAKVKNKRKSGLADKVHNKRKAEANKKQLNPFEVHINREKIQVLGKKSKHDRGLPGVSRAKAIQKRKETLGTEMKLLNKTNTFIDRRIGEKNNQLSSEDRLIARFAAERARQHSRKNIYNLADDEILTHRGQTLEDIEKFDDPRSSDEEDDDGRKLGGLDDEFVSEGHFGGGILSRTESNDGAKSHKDLIEQLIAESKKRKAEKQKEKELTLDMTEKLDSEWKDLQPVVFKRPRIEEKPIEDNSSLIDKLLSKADKKGEDYDKTMRELRFEKRGTPSDSLKNEEQMQKEERSRLEELEKQREMRMSGQEVVIKKPNNKHRSADDLDDNFALDDDEAGYMLSYDKDGNPNIPEHIVKQHSGFPSSKQFEEGYCDTSSDDDDDDDNDDESEDESDDNEDEEDEKSKQEESSNDSNESENEGVNLKLTESKITENKNESNTISKKETANNDEIVEDDNESVKNNKVKSNNKNTIPNAPSDDDEKSSEEGSVDIKNQKAISAEKTSSNHQNYIENSKCKDSITNSKTSKEIFYNKSIVDAHKYSNNKIVENKDEIKNNTNNEIENGNNISDDDDYESSDDDSSNDDQKSSKIDIDLNNFNDLKDIKESDQESENDLSEDVTGKITTFFSFENKEGDNLKELLEGKTAKEQSIVLEKLIKKYDPSLSKDNKDNLTRLYAHLLQYLNDIFTNLNTEEEIKNSFEIFNKIAPHFYNLSHKNKVITKKYLVEVITEKRSEYLKKPKRIPDLDTLIFFKLVSLIYPTSDFRHPVVTPCFVFMSEILHQSNFNSAYSISRGIFIATLLLEYTVLSKKLVPAKINFLRGIIYLCANISILNPVTLVPPFKLRKNDKYLNLENDCSKKDMKFKMVANDFVIQEVNDGFKIRCLSTCVAILRETFDYFNDIEAQECLFKPHIDLLNKVDIEWYPKDIAAKIMETVRYMQEMLEVKTFKPMAEDKKRPKALRLYEPDVQEVFTDGKSSKCKEKAERDKLKHKLKKEMKGALREIRRDKAYIASVKIRQKIQSDNIRKDKVKQIYKDASIQQGELNKLKRMK